MTQSIDCHIGRRIEALRQNKGLSLHELAAKLALAPDELAEREAGNVRTSAAELFMLAVILEVAISAFFADL